MMTTMERVAFDKENAAIARIEAELAASEAATGTLPDDGPTTPKTPEFPGTPPRSGKAAAKAAPAAQDEEVLLPASAVPSETSYSAPQPPEAQPLTAGASAVHGYLAPAP